MMKSLKFTSLLLALVLSQTAGANALYSWKHKDGTPTFSPDPPPKGVPYVIVGPDLKPIPQPLPGLQQGNDNINQLTLQHSSNLHQRPQRSLNGSLSGTQTIQTPIKRGQSPKHAARKQQLRSIRSHRSAST